MSIAIAVFPSPKLILAQAVMLRGNLRFSFSDLSIPGLSRYTERLRFQLIIAPLYYALFTYIHHPT